MKMKREYYEEISLLKFKNQKMNMMIIYDIYMGDFPNRLSNIADLTLTEETIL